MHELDLIPEDYRQRLQIQRKCKIFAYIFTAVLLGIVGFKYLLIQRSVSLQAEIESLQNDQKVYLQQQQKFNSLLAQEQLVTQRLEILQQLHGNLSAKDIFKAIDRVLDGNVWFTTWSFHRSIELAKLTSQSAQKESIEIPEKDSGNQNSYPWRLISKMEISGQALDHSMLASFVGNLIEQPEIADVKVLNTNLKSYTFAQVVDFKMVIDLNEQR